MQGTRWSEGLEVGEQDVGDASHGASAEPARGLVASVGNLLQCNNTHSKELSELRKLQHLQAIRRRGTRELANLQTLDTCSFAPLPRDEEPPHSGTVKVSL